MRVGTLIKRRWNGHIGVVTQQTSSTSDRWLVHFINVEGYRWCGESELEILCE